MTTQFGSYKDAIKVIKNIDPDQIETSTMYLVIAALEKAEAEEMSRLEGYYDERFAWSNYKHDHCERLEAEEEASGGRYSYEGE